MPLPPLADLTDLPATWQAAPNAPQALDEASAAIRDAAGSVISAVDATVSTAAPVTGTLLTLPGPVRDVTAVSVDGEAVTDYRNVGNGLWRRCGWGCEPVPVEVTATFGLPEVPADIVGLTVDLAIARLLHDQGGGGSNAGLLGVRIDDASEQYNEESAGAVSPVYIPAATRDWLAARFGGGASVVETL